MSEIFDANHLPAWLVAVASMVDELLTDRKVMERFRAMLREWKIDHDKRGPKSRVDKKGNIQYNKVDFMPRRRWTLPEKYARLAAIHDTICERVKRVDLWSTHKRWVVVGASKAKAGIPYTVLCHRVDELGDSDREHVENTLRDVHDDLARSLSIRDQVEKSPETKLSAPAPAPGFTVMSLRSMTGLGNTAINSYAKKAGVKTPGRGQRNFQYPRQDVYRILQQIVVETAAPETNARCQRALRNLGEITR